MSNVVCVTSWYASAALSGGLRFCSFAYEKISPMIPPVLPVASLLHDFAATLSAMWPPQLVQLFMARKVVLFGSSHELPSYTCAFTVSTCSRLAGYIWCSEVSSALEATKIAPCDQP
jgi:hypothetical protein